MSAFVSQGFCFHSLFVTLVELTWGLLRKHTERLPTFFRILLPAPTSVLVKLGFKQHWSYLFCWWLNAWKRKCDYSHTQGTPFTLFWTVKTLVLPLMRTALVLCCLRWIFMLRRKYNIKTPKRAWLRGKGVKIKPLVSSLFLFLTEFSLCDRGKSTYPYSKGGFQSYKQSKVKTVVMTTGENRNVDQSLNREPYSSAPSSL